MTDHDDHSNEKWITDAQVNTSIDKKNLLTYGVQFRRQEAISTRINNGSIAWSRTREGITDTAGKATINYGSYFVQHQWKPSRKWVIIRCGVACTIVHFKAKTIICFIGNTNLRRPMAIKCIWRIVANSRNNYPFTTRFPLMLYKVTTVING